MSESIEQSESLELDVLEKLNKILKQKNLELVCDNTHSDSANPVFFRCIKKDFYLQVQNQKYGWDTLHSVFFTSEPNNYSNIFIWTRLVLKHQREFPKLETHICKSFQDLGLMCLENCSSWEEILFKMNIMYPEF